ncbi:MAG: type II secretion system protein GspM [Pseudomonadota bacterium]
MSKAAPLLHRAGALALLAGVLVLLWAGLAQPIYLHFEDLRSRAAEATRVAEAFSARLQDTEVVVERLPEGLVYRGLAAPLVAADMQRRINSAVTEAGGTTLSTLTLDPEAGETTLKLSVLLEAQFETETLSDFLLSIEASKPLLLVEELDIARRPSEAPGGPGILRVDIVLSTYLDPPEG